MGKMGKRIDRLFNQMEKKRRQMQRIRGYRKRYSFVVHSRVKDTPKEVSAAAISSVWKKFGDVDPHWAQYYWSVNGIASPYYIPSDVWFCKVCPCLNSAHRFGWPLFQDKNYLDRVFKGVRQPEVIIRNVSGQFLDADYHLITAEKAAALCEGQGELIVKPSIESKGGRSIEFINSAGCGDADSPLEIFKKRPGDYVVQKVIRQHPQLASLNPDSINSVRVLTLLWKGEARVLSALVRIGVKGCRVDNPHLSNGVSCVLTSEGKMIGTAYDRDWNPHLSLPNGMELKGFQVPFFDRIVETVLQLHGSMPHFRLIGWDMTVSEDGEPILIEANLDTPEIYFHQLGGGPVIQDPELFDEIMRYVTRK